MTTGELLVSMSSVADGSTAIEHFANIDNGGFFTTVVVDVDVQVEQTLVVATVPTEVQLEVSTCP